MPKSPVEDRIYIWFKAIVMILGISITIRECEIDHANHDLTRFRGLFDRIFLKNDGFMI